MTCVVGVRGRKGVLLAGDSQYSWDNRNGMGKEPKTFELSEVLAVAYHGSGRLGQLLIHHLDELEDPPLGRDEMRWAVKEFVPYLRDVAQAHGFLHIHRNVEHLGDENGFLFAVRDRLFLIEGDLAVNEHRRPFDAIGSGHEVAIGAMNALVNEPTDPLPDTRIERVARAGVAAASEHTNFVGGDITFVRTLAVTAEERAFARSLLRVK